jgi:hypothetical protein
MGGWGFLVHKTVGQLAVYQLPKGIRSFFYSRLDSLETGFIKPDLRREWDYREAPRHFIDLEAYGDSSAWKMPHSWDSAVSRFGLDSLKKYGYLPYAIMGTRERLIQAFRIANKDSILLYAADLCHYLSDAHVPLHTTVNYDGQLSGQKGIHALWESAVPGVEIDRYNLYSGHKAQYLEDPAGAVWQTIRRSNGMLHDLLEKERLLARDVPDSAKYTVSVRNGRNYRSYSRSFAAKYAVMLGSSVNEELLRSAELTADFWYTCWKDAGSPDLGYLLPDTWSSHNRKELKRDYNAYRKNELLEKKLLLARQREAVND